VNYLILSFFQNTSQGLEVSACNRKARPTSTETFSMFEKLTAKDFVWLGKRGMQDKLSKNIRKIDLISLCN